MSIVFGVLITIAVYSVCRMMYRKLRIALLNPILISIVILMVFLNVFELDYSYYNNGGSWITFMLGPIVVLLAVPLYKNRDKIAGHFIPIATGIASGIIASFASVIFLSKMLGLNEEYLSSLYSKSITTPLAVEVTRMTEGIESLTIVAVIMTGITGATIAPAVMKIGRVKNEIAKGIGIGSSSHGVGTSKAVEMGEETAGASGLAMGLTGVATVLVASVFFG